MSITPLKKEYAIARILGNELPPRDSPGTRLQVVKFIIANEYLSGESCRFWLLNRILDESFLMELKATLDQAGERYIEEEIEWHAYMNAYSRDERLTILININKARNRCIEEGRKLAHFTIVLDGDCFFDEDAWARSINFIANDQLTNVDRKYYAHSSHRLVCDLSRTAKEAGMMLTQMKLAEPKLEEPMVTFRCDAELSFDESIPFGKGEKQEFLTRIGLVRRAESWHQKRADSIGALGGVVRHLQTGSSAAESDFMLRLNLRERSLNYVLQKADDTLRHKLRSSGKWAPFLRFSTMRACAVLESATAMIKKKTLNLSRRFLPMDS